MSKHSWKSHLGTALFIAALIIIANPELRLLLLFANSIGLEVLLLLVATQLRTFWPFLRIFVEPTLIALCKLSSCIGLTAIRAFPVVLPFRQLGKLLCPILMLLSYGLLCPVKDSSLASIGAE